MKQWWDGLSLLGQIFSLVAIPATIVMIIQSLLMLFGMGFDSDAEALDGGEDMSGELGDGDGLSLFTIRGLVAFFAVGGWSGLVALHAGVTEAVAILIAILAGLVALYGIAMLFKYSMKLQDSGNLSTKNAIGKTGEVYIPIPENHKGTGKVMITMQERLCELTAVTSEESMLHTGELVVVSEIVDDQTVLVVRHNRGKTIENKGGISKWVQK